MTAKLTPLEAVRGGLRESADPRAARTFQRIVDAVTRLSENDEPINVSAIVAEAGVSRATFYTHFASLDELAVRMQESAFAHIADDARRLQFGSGTEAMLASQQQLLQHYADNRALYATVFSLPNAPTVWASVSDAMARDVLEHIFLRQSEGMLPVDVQPEIAAHYIANAASGVIFAWIRGRIDADVDTLALHLLNLMPRWMHRDSIGNVGESDVPHPKG